MKTPLLFILLMFLSCLAGAQDIIYKKNGEEIRAKIIDVTPGVIKYKKFENQGGHVFSIAREQVGRIAYENGQTTYFREEEPKREKITEESPPQRKRPSSTFGWHIGFGGSTINGEYINSTWQLASTIGASFNLNIGAQSTLLFGAEILSIGCGLKDENYFDFRDSSYYEFSNWNQDMGYIGLEVMFRQYFNHGRNYFFDIGLYGSFLINATWQGDVVITDTAGNVTEGPFNEDLTDFYQPLDYGLAGGVGGRIPLGESKKWHITLEARFYYGLQNIFDYKSLNLLESRESNIYGILLVGVDLPTNSSD